MHGLGATGRVWDGLIEVLDPAWHWVAPDLPGHGASAPLDGYTFGGIAAAIAPVVRADRQIAVVGHSLGGVIGLVVASGWFGVSVGSVCGLGIKVQWAHDELVKAAELASRPRRTFDDRGEAVQRALRVAGLIGIVEPDDPAATSAVVEVDAGWTLAMDPSAFAVGAPDMHGLLAAARAQTVMIAAGECDPMSPADQLRDLQADATILPGLGHNAHVEDPAALLPIVARLAD